MSNLFKNGNNGLFNNTNDPNGNPPSDWGLTVDTDYLASFNNTDPITGNGSLNISAKPQVMILTYETTSANQEVFINKSVFSDSTTNINIDWGDGNQGSIVGNQSVSNIYTTAGTYTVTLTGESNRLVFSDESALKYVEEFSPIINIGSFSFGNCTGLIELRNTNNIPVLESIAFQNTFINCSSLTGGVGFEGNQDFSNVTNMFRCFEGCDLFNANISQWNVENIANFGSSFRNCLTFNQNLGGWNIASLTNAANMFNGATLSTSNYNALLIGWDSQPVKNTVTFHGGNSTYTLGGAAETARTNLINDHSWAITDGGGI